MVLWQTFDLIFSSIISSMRGEERCSAALHIVYNFVLTFCFRNLASNPFNCNCHLAWFADWLRKHQFMGEAARCASPNAVRDVQIRDLMPNEFKCINENTGGCLGKGYCPTMCSCTGTVVRCSRSNLTEIPQGLPSETTELYLESNEIDAIDVARLQHLKSLTRLDLSNNKIQMLSDYTFANLTKLSTL